MSKLDYLKKNYNLIELPLGEENAANCIRINNKLLIPDGFSKTEEILSKSFNIIKIKNNQKTLEIRKKNKYTDCIDSTITFASSSNTITKNVKKIIIVNDIISYINSIDISLTGWSSKKDYINKLKSLYKKI